MKTVVHARVRVTLDIPLPGHWGDDVPASQVVKQALDDVRGLLRQGVAIDNLATHGSSRVAADIVGVPMVTAIMVDLNAKPEGT